MKRILSIIIIAAFSLGLQAQVALVTNTNDAGPGSLRQAINDANASGSINTIAFNIPTADGNYNPTTGVFTISVTSTELPELTRWGVTIDGSTQTAHTGNSNTYMFGTGGTVGVDNLLLSKVDGPEIAIVDGVGNLKWGLRLGGRNITVKNLAIHSFGNGWFLFDNANLLAGPSAGNLRVEACVLGSLAHTSAPPTSDINGGPNFQAIVASEGTFVNNFVAYSETMGAFFKNGNRDWLIENNEFYKNGLTNNICDGLDMADNTERATIRGNLFKDNGAVGLDFFNSTGDHLVENNTLHNNGLLGRETPGIRLYGNNGGTIRKNKIFDNVGAGILVTSGAKAYEITENSIYNNGNVLALGATTTSNQLGIDLLESSDNHMRGTHPYITLNDINDADDGGNCLQNFPVIDGLYISGGMVTVRGFARGGSKIEFFKASTYPGALMEQGKTFLFSASEGSSADNDPSTGSYGPGLINGKNYGEDQIVNRFEFSFPAPAGFSVGDEMTATAFLPNCGTSEFAPAYIASGSVSSDLIPNVNCVYIDVNGDLVGRFGYNNPNSGTVTQSIGANNGFSPTPVNRGQPTSFSPGTHSGIFDVTFPSSGTLTWNLQGNSVSADFFSPRCLADLKVTQSASNNTPHWGDNVTFTVTVENLTAATPATAVEILYFIDPSFNFVSANVPSGTSYNPATGVWLIPQVVNGSPVSMDIVVTTKGNGTNVASVQSQNQPDPDPTNNSAAETIALTASGGHGGGIESEGSMATLIASRNFKRLKTGEHAFYQHINEKPKLADVRNNNMSKTQALIDLIPTQGPQNSTPVVTSPTDLIGITNAVNIFAVDYYKPNQKRLGAILAIETSNAVYNHTKVICDRLNGAELSEAKTINIKGHSFLMARLNQPDSAVDQAVSFVAYEDANGNFSVDARWNQGSYKIPAGAKVYNFQVWSVSQSVTISMVEDILDELESRGSVNYLNPSNVSVPTLYIKKGEYANGKVILDIVNTVGANEITINASTTRYENAPREYNNITFVIDSTKTEQRIVWNTGYIFDLDFTMTNNIGGGVDLLYFADGPWGVDYERNTGVRNAVFDVHAETGFSAVANEKRMERSINFSGNMKNYVTVYRMLRPGNGTVDLSDYNRVEFEASLSGVNEIVVTLVSDKIEAWANQFRATVSVSNAANNTYTLDFADLRSANGGELDLSSIVNISFSLVGDQQNFKPLAFEVGKVIFSQTGRALNTNEHDLVQSEKLNVYPNPFSESLNIDLQLEGNGEVQVELFDLSGKVVDAANLGNYFRGTQTATYVPSENLKEGVYLLKVHYDKRSITRRVVYRK